MDWEAARIKQKNSILRSFKMYADTRKSTEERMKVEPNEDGNGLRYTEADIQSTLKQMDEALEETMQQFIMLGGTEEEVKEYLENGEKNEKKRPLAIDIDDVMNMTEGSKESVSSKLTKARKKADNKEEKKTTSTKKEDGSRKTLKKLVETTLVDKVDFIPKEYKYDPMTEFDLIPLPSKGQCYPSKNNTVGVSPLNATDENILTSPNLYREMKVVDIILKRKIMNNIDPNELLPGDRDAIVLWLRATGYGNDYPVSVRDSKTGEDINGTIDLSEVNFKPFNLVGDENGWFDYTLPVSKDKIKFKYLNYREISELNEIDKYENTLTMKGEILTMSRLIDRFVHDSNSLKEECEEKLNEAVRNIVDATELMDTANTMGYTERLTNKLIYSIMEINGNQDRDYIENYVKKMPARDAFSLRQYIDKNEPGIDMHFNVERPADLGGGQIPVFLSVNQFTLYNVPR